jgi:hypothetical protein
MLTSPPQCGQARTAIGAGVDAGARSSLVAAGSV